MSVTDTTVSFAQFSADFSARLSLDSDYNEAIYNEENKSSFLPNETAYLKLLPGESTKAYYLGSSFGTLSIANKNVLYDYSEDINFILEKEATLSFVPNAGVSYSWIGNNGGTPLFVGKAVVIPSNIIGILRCSYQVMGDRLKLSNADVGLDEYNILCVVDYIGDYNISLSVSFEVGDDPGSEEIRLEVAVVDMCTGDVIPNASVIIDGLDSGVTNSDGIFYPMPTVNTGQTYDIKVTATGYQNSDADFLKNDSFTIPL